MINKIISGGQTGADIAGLDVAIKAGIPCGGWCPRGRKYEKGRIPDRYPLQETVLPDYFVRTELNVKDSDATLLFTFGVPAGGSALTVQFAGKHRKPVLHIDLSDNAKELLSDKICDWIKENNIHILNIAGSRESKNPGIYKAVYNILISVLTKSV